MPIAVAARYWREGNAREAADEVRRSRAAARESTAAGAFRQSRQRPPPPHRRACIASATARRRRGRPFERSNSRSRRRACAPVQLSGLPSSVPNSAPAATVNGSAGTPSDVPKPNTATKPIDEAEKAVRLPQSGNVLERVPVVEPAELVPNQRCRDEQQRQPTDSHKGGARRRERMSPGWHGVAWRRKCHIPCRDRVASRGPSASPDSAAVLRARLRYGWQLSRMIPAAWRASSAAPATAPD